MLPKLRPSSVTLRPLEVRPHPEGVLALGSSDASSASTSSRSSRFAIQLTERAKASTSSRLETCSCSTAPSWISPNGVPSKTSRPDSAAAHRLVQLVSRVRTRAGADRVDRLVPEPREHTARPQHARDLGDRDVVGEPVERLAGEDASPSAVVQRDRLRDTRAAPPPAAPAPRGSHGAPPAARRRSRGRTELRGPGSALPVPAARSSTVASSATGTTSSSSRRPAGPAPLVRLGHALEALGLLSRHLPAETSAAP
jgi:hypothetical protein